MGRSRALGPDRHGPGNIVITTRDGSLGPDPTEVLGVGVDSLSEHFNNYHGEGEGPCRVKFVV